MRQNIQNFRQILTAVICLSTLTYPVTQATAKPNIADLKKPQNIKLTATPINFEPDAPEKKKFGKLIWRGGLALASPSPYFGGFSGLAISRDGKKIISVSDAGFWLQAELTYNGHDLTSVKKAKIGPLLTPTTKTKRGKGKKGLHDAEAIALLGRDLSDGAALISFERKHRIVPYKISTQVLVQGKPVKLPKSARNLKANKGLEAIEIIRAGKLKGAIITFPERLKDKRGNLKGWLIKKNKSKKITVKRFNGYDITGLAALPDGGLLLLERRFRFSEGVKMRIRHIGAKNIKPGALIKGEILIQTSNARHAIDNMEGIAAHRAQNGETIITLISDDNFNFFQRTLIMQFALRKKPLKRVNTKASSN